MSDGRQSLQPHDELWGSLRQRLIDEGLPRERAEALATALVDADARPGALEELEGRLDRLTDLIERLDTEVERVADSLEGASSAAAAPPSESSTRANVPAAAHERAARHPIHAVEHEVEHLHDVAEEGESPATPAIVGGGVLAFLVPLVAILIAFAFAIYYVASRGGNSSEQTAAPAFTSEELAAQPTDNWITNGGSLSTNGTRRSTRSRRPTSPG
jgi:hypothetical protein